jgi:hypothetical protein
MRPVARRRAKRISNCRPTNGWNGCVTMRHSEGVLDDPAVCRDRRNPQHTHLATVFRDFDSSVPERPIGARDQFVSKLSQECFDTARLDRLQRHAVNARRSVVPLGKVIRGAQCFQLSHVDVQAPEPPVLVSLRLDVQPPPQVLQTDGRHCQGAPAFRVVGDVAEQQGPFAPRALPRLFTTSGPSATLSSSADFPGAPVIRPTLLHRFRGGTRRASPVARRALVTVLSLPTPPEWPAAPASLRRPMLPSRSSCTLGLRGSALSRPSRVHLRYGPVTRSPSSRWLRRWAPKDRSPSLLPSKLRCFWLLPRWDCLPLNTSAFTGRTTRPRLS